MSLFGMLDAQSIPTNPFFVEAGEYSAVVSKAIYKTNRDGVRQLQISYTITDDDSQFVDATVSQYFDLVAADMTLETFNTLPADEKAKIRRTNSALKRTLCGNDSNADQRGLGVESDDLNDKNWDPKVLEGTAVNICITNYGATNEGVNIKWVNKIED